MLFEATETFVIIGDLCQLVLPLLQYFRSDIFAYYNTVSNEIHINVV